jgi:hypothetical protein
VLRESAVNLTRFDRLKEVADRLELCVSALDLSQFEKVELWSVMLKLTRFESMYAFSSILSFTYCVLLPSNIIAVEKLLLELLLVERRLLMISFKSLVTLMFEFSEIVLIARPSDNMERLVDRVSLESWTCLWRLERLVDRVSLESWTCLWRLERLVVMVSLESWTCLWRLERLAVRVSSEIWNCLWRNESLVSTALDSDDREDVARPKLFFRLSEVCFDKELSDQFMEFDSVMMLLLAIVKDCEAL